jgi:hypothetical protein
MSYPILRHALEGHDLLVFYDVEGTQFSHRMISIGLVAYPKMEDGLSLDMEHPITYHSLVSCEDEIGFVVEKMTGLATERLIREGKSVKTVFCEIRKLLRHYHCKFFCYGNFDLKMIHYSLDENDLTEINFFRYMTKNNLDFHSYLEQRVCDKNGQSYSIERLLNLFDLEPQGEFHDPLMDSVNLARIYQEYVKDEDKIIALYLEHFPKNPFQSGINRIMMSKLLENGNVDLSDLKNLLKENL